MESGRLLAMSGTTDLCASDSAFSLQNFKDVRGFDFGFGVKMKDVSKDK